MGDKKVHEVAYPSPARMVVAEASRTSCTGREAESHLADLDDILR